LAPGLVVEVAAHRARDQRGDAAPGRRWRHAHHAEKGFERQIEAPGQPADHPFRIERDVQIPRLVEIVGQGARQRTDQIVAPVLPQLDVENVELQYVAGFGAGNRDRAGQDMARHHPFTLRMDIGEFGRDVKLGTIGQHVRSAADGIDGDLVAAGDRQHRLQLRFEKAPMAGLGAGMQVMMCHEVSLEYCNDGV
jgi:hypothetical protein